MNTRVAARLALGGSYTNRCFELRDVVTSLHVLDPSRVVLGFVQDADGAATLHLDCDFDGAGDAARAQRLKENLLRGDIAGRYDCVFADDWPDWTGGESLGLLTPDDAQLPGGQWFALPASLQDAAVDLFRHAAANGLQVGLRIELTARAADAALARQLIPALAAVATRRRQPAIEAALGAAIAVTRRSGWSARETLHLAADGAGAGGEWLGRLVLRRLQSAADFLPDDYWSLVDAAQSAPSGLSPGTQVQRARAADCIDDLFELIAPSLNHDVMASPAAPPMSAAVDGDYVFVSYAHVDREYGNEVIQRLRDAGVRVWFDAGIGPGTVWDETLEQRIRDAGAVVVCLTAGYEGSRYCTRELKFADLLAKPILPIAPTAWVWGKGLQLMFQELQVAAYEQGRGFGPLRDALRDAAPRVFGPAVG